ncbi:hypothetical protein [Pueribacillus theae]|nr:hypothetical protein [Pueribacillus theae]
MKKNKLAMTTVALGAAYLLRNKDSRQKLKEQFQSFMNSSRKSKKHVNV